MKDRPPREEGHSPEGAGESLLAQLDPQRLPRHIAVIMDGNGRWARERGLPRVAGHRAGIASVRETLESSARLGVEVLTLYAFSTENWKRPAAEVNTLMGLLREFIDKELQKIHEQGVSFRCIGRVEDLPSNVVKRLRHAEELTSANSGMVFQVALSYSGRSEIAEAVRKIANEVAAGTLEPGAIDEEAISSRLYTAGLPDPDLLIRTSGEMRVSNYLLWQIAYAELWVTPVLWPDFRREDLYEAILDYQGRERRFGGVEDASSRPRKAGFRRLFS